METEAENQGMVEADKGGGGEGKRPARCERVVVATYNIHDGRGGRLRLTARALDHANVDIAVGQEVKLKDPKFAPRTGFECQIHTTAAGTNKCVWKVPCR